MKVVAVGLGASSNDRCISSRSKMVVRFLACVLIVLSESEGVGVGVGGVGGALLTRTETSNLGSGGGATTAMGGFGTTLATAVSVCWLYPSE